MENLTPNLRNLFEKGKEIEIERDYLNWLLGLNEELKTRNLDNSQVEKEIKVAKETLKELISKIIEDSYKLIPEELVREQEQGLRDLVK
jgi:hypothetical protein